MRYNRLKAKVSGGHNGKSDFARTTPVKKDKADAGRAKSTGGEKRKIDVSWHEADDEAAAGREQTPLKGKGEKAVKDEPEDDDDFA